MCWAEKLAEGCGQVGFMLIESLDELIVVVPTSAAPPSTPEELAFLSEPESSF
jgi:hypothetical protein